MKRRAADSEASQSKGKGKKRPAEKSAPSLSRTRRGKKDGETSKAGSPPPLKAAGVQRRGVHGSILHYIYKNTLGQSLHSQMRQCLQEPFIRSLSSYHFHSATSPFDRRITCLEWNPVHRTTLAVASKGGDIHLWDYKVPEKKTFIQGMGPGDSVTDMRFNQLNPTQLFISSMRGTTSLRDLNGATLTVFANMDTRNEHVCDGADNCPVISWRLCAQNGAGDFIGGIKFCPTDSSRVYVASGEGNLTMQSFEGLTPTTLSTTQDCGHDHHNVCYWYCCVDVSVSRQMLVTGDNMGQLSLLGLDGQKIFSNKLHKAKVTHAEFNTRCDWLLATASVDHTVKLWDLRNIKDQKSFLHDLPHEKAVNSASFNPFDCSKLLTTDQYDQIRVYSSSDWSTPQHIIQHPHRQFQHLTPIKATWHPVYDLIVAGRYPDERVCSGDQRSVDIYDANTAELVYQLYDPTASGIKSVNKFNHMGDVIGTGMGVTVLVWDRNESLISDGDTQPQEDTSASVDSLRRPKRSRQNSNKERKAPALDAKLKKKLASLEECETKTKTKPKLAQMRKK